MYKAGLSSSSKIREVFCNRVWTRSRYLLDKYPLLSSINLLNINPNAPDQLEWHNELGLSKPFFVAMVWSTIRPRKSKVDWCNVVWFSSCIPHHAFNFWLVIKQRLKMQDKLARWDVLDLEPHEVLAKLVMAATAYFIWQERNGRLFKNNKRSVNQVIEVIFSSVRLKLLSCRFKKSKDGVYFAQLWSLPATCFGH
ncbi:retrotransposon gag domain, retroviral aspartyl protease [Tanacetum coccineum]